MTNGKCLYCDRTFEIRWVKNGQTRCPYCLKFNGELGARNRWTAARVSAVFIFELKMPVGAFRELNRDAEFKSNGNVSGGDVIDETIKAAARKLSSEATVDFIDYREKAEGE